MSHRNNFSKFIFFFLLPMYPSHIDVMFDLFTILPESPLTNVLTLNNYVDVLYLGKIVHHISEIIMIKKMFYFQLG